MSDGLNLFDFSEFSRLQPSVRSSISSASTGLLPLGAADTPATSPPLSESRLSVKSASDVVTSISLTGPFILSFVKGSKLFKLRYAQIDICRDAAGALRCIELSDPATMSGVFVHVFSHNKRPIPHLETPASHSHSSLRVYFFDEQSVQVAQTIFVTQPQYNFDNIDDCNRFQQEVLGLSLPFVAGVAEISSKGRGEEAISQNLRICKTAGGQMSLLFFANAQRKGQKRYLTLSVDCIDKVEQPKKKNKPIHLKLNSSSNLAASMKNLSILFIDGDEAGRFVALLQEAGIPIFTKH